MKSSNKSLKQSSSQTETNSNPLAALDLIVIASELRDNAENPDYIRTKADQLEAIALQAMDVLAMIASNFPEFETQAPPLESQTPEPLAQTA